MRTKETESNNDLFAQGIFAKLKKGFGVVLVILGICLIGLSPIIGVLMVLGGGVLIFFGARQRFDYKRRSGSIIHKGDF